MRRRIRGTTEDLEPRVVLSVTSLVPRDATPPADAVSDSSIATPDEATAADSGRVTESVEEPVDSTNSSDLVDAGPPSSLPDTDQNIGTDEPVDSVSQSRRGTQVSETTRDQSSVLIIREITVNVNDTVDDASATRAKIAFIEAERTGIAPKDSDSSAIQWDLDDVIGSRDTTDDNGIEAEDVSVASEKQDVVESVAGQQL